MFDEGTSEMNLSPLVLPSDYAQWLASLKQRIQGARQRALLAANGEQIRLYYDIGPGPATPSIFRSKTGCTSEKGAAVTNFDQRLAPPHDLSG